MIMNLIFSSGKFICFINFSEQKNNKVEKYENFYLFVSNNIKYKKLIIIQLFILIYLKI